MPDRSVQTIQDLIFYQYAKTITKRAFSVPGGQAAKGQHYGFIKKTFRELQSGAKSWSEITREDWQLVESEKKCIYCGSATDLHKEHIVPKSLLIKAECASCAQSRASTTRFGLAEHVTQQKAPWDSMSFSD